MNWICVCLADLRRTADLLCSRRPELDHERHGPTERRLDQMLLVFQVFPELIEHWALLSALGIAEINEMDQHTVDDCSVLKQARFDLLEELVLLFVLPTRL